MKVIKKEIMCPRCGQIFESEELISGWSDGADLDTRMRGTIRYWTTHNYNKCPECGCVFDDEKEPLFLNDDAYDWLIKEVTGRFEDETVQAALILREYLTYQFYTMDDDLTISEFKGMCIDRLARSNRLIWALDDAGEDATDERYEKIYLINSILDLYLFEEDWFEDLQIMRVEENRRLGNFKEVMEDFVLIKDPFKQKIIAYERHLASIGDDKVHGINEVDNFITNEEENGE